MAPAEISKVFIDEVSRAMEVVVPDNQLSLAIGKKGQNVRLAAKLTGWKLDIVSESQAASKAADAVFNLMLVPGVNDTLATSLFQHGFGSFQSIADASAEEVSHIPGFDESSAGKLVEEAKKLVEKYADDAESVPTRPEDTSSDDNSVSAESAAVPAGNARDLAEQRLKEGLAELAGASEAKTDSEAESTETAE